jgi:hypothetical protein
MQTLIKNLVAGTATLILTCSASQAAPFAVLETGVSAPGVATPVGSPDVHYTITAGPTGAQPAIVSTPPPGGFPNVPPNGQWVSPSLTGTGADPFPGGDYTYQTQFNLGNPNTGVIAFASDTAMISFSVAADDQFAAFLNGVQLFPAIPGTFGGGPLALSNFFVQDGVNGVKFNSFVNTLTFQVRNAAAGPTGLLVLVANEDALAVPELDPSASAVPAITCLLMLGLIWDARRRNSAVPAQQA